jgi:hypothetical protein
MKILILMSLYKQMEAPSAISLCAMQADIYNHKDVSNMILLHGYNAATARELLWKEADEKGDADYVLNLDSDHVYKASAMYNLIKHLEENKLQILSAKYSMKQLEPRELSMLRGDTFETTKRVPYDPNEKGLQRVDVMGLGFCVIKPALIRMMRKKYKELFRDSDAETNVGIVDDVAFAKKCKQQDIPLYYDADVVVGHVGTIVY